MMKRVHPKLLNIRSGIKYLFYPIAFFLIIVALCFVSMGSALTLGAAAVNMFVMNKPLNLDREVSDIFVEPIVAQVIQENVEPEQPETIKKSEIRFPSAGDLFARISIPSIGLEDAPLYNGAEPKQLIRGVGISNGAFPGQGCTIMAGAHNNTHFRNLPKINEGDIVEIRASYGIYKYQVTSKKEALHDDKSAYPISFTEESLILYTCVERGTVGATPYRLFVYLEYISGPKWVR